MSVLTGSETNFSEHIVFVDESGDHGLANIDAQYPIFVLVFCLFRKTEYIQNICPKLQTLKMQFWGHDSVVLHEHDIRKPTAELSFLFDPEKRARFMEAVNDFIINSSFLVVASVIDKTKLKDSYHTPANPYDLCLEFGLERIYRELAARGDTAGTTSVVVERRGKKEDDELELTFRRVRDGENYLRARLPFELSMVSKSANSAGLQIADLIARPIGIHILRSKQPNRAYEIIEPKIRRKPATGEIAGWGIKVFPS